MPWELISVIHSDDGPQTEKTLHSIMVWHFQTEKVAQIRWTSVE